MGRANISDFDEFLTIAEYLERMGWIAEADAGVSEEVAQSTIGSCHKRAYTALKGEQTSPRPVWAVGKSPGETVLCQ
jgi:hypothetical protein